MDVLKGILTRKLNSLEVKSPQGNMRRMTAHAEETAGKVQACAGCVCFNHVVKFYFQQVLLVLQTTSVSVQMLLVESYHL
jgi:hypothetical protein